MQVNHRIKIVPLVAGCGTTALHQEEKSVCAAAARVTSITGGVTKVEAEWRDGTDCLQDTARPTKVKERVVPAALSAKLLSSLIRGAEVSGLTITQVLCLS